MNALSLRESWSRVSRADRVVYVAAVALVVLSFAPHIRVLTHTFEATEDPSSIFALRRHARDAQELIFSLAVLFVLGWEVAKAGYRALAEASPALVGVFVAIPVALPLTALAAWLAKLLEPQIPEHPLFTQLVPLPWGVGATVYLLTTALVVVGLKELREREPPG